jgi:hypothetical protein
MGFTDSKSNLYKLPRDALQAILLPLTPKAVSRSYYRICKKMANPHHQYLRPLKVTSYLMSIDHYEARKFNSGIDLVTAAAQVIQFLQTLKKNGIVFSTYTDKRMRM